jgi:hypothetical protein
MLFDNRFLLLIPTLPRKLNFRRLLKALVVVGDGLLLGRGVLWHLGFLFR